MKSFLVYRQRWCLCDHLIALLITIYCIRLFNLMVVSTEHTTTPKINCLMPLPSAEFHLIIPMP